jgi:hypothetical protein
MCVCHPVSLPAGDKSDQARRWSGLRHYVCKGLFGPQGDLLGTWAVRTRGCRNGSKGSCGTAAAFESAAGGVHLKVSNRGKAGVQSSHNASTQARGSTRRIPRQLLLVKKQQVNKLRSCGWCSRFFSSGALIS